MQASTSSLHHVVQPFTSRTHMQRACRHHRAVEVYAGGKGFGTIARKGFGLVKKQDYWG